MAIAKPPIVFALLHTQSLIASTQFYDGGPLQRVILNDSYFEMSVNEQKMDLVQIPEHPKKFSMEARVVSKDSPSDTTQLWYEEQSAREFTPVALVIILAATVSEKSVLSDDLINLESCTCIARA